MFLNDFKSVFGEPALKYKLYIEGVLCYSTVTSSNNVFLMNALLEKMNINYITSLKEIEIQNLRDSCYQNSRTYFST